MENNHLKFIVIAIIVLVAVVFLLFPGVASKQHSTEPSFGKDQAGTSFSGRNSGEDEQPAQLANGVVSNDENATGENSRSDEEVARLIDKHLSPAMKREINQMLQPEDAEYPVIETDNGSVVDLSQRATTVPIAIIDDDGEMVVTDITQPIPVDSDAGNTPVEQAQ